MSSENLGRYYTDPSISRLLVASLKMRFASTILDIGVGDGSLARAALIRYRQASLISADIEAKQKSIVSLKPDKVKFFEADGLCKNFSKKLCLKVGEIDIAVCNPPYQKIKMKEHHRSLLTSIGFIELSKRTRLTSEILFLAQNLRLLKEGGEIGIILPDTLLSGSKFMPFRKDIFANTIVMGVIQLPERIFSKTTEALTHILLLKKEKPKQKYTVPIKTANTNGLVTNTIIVDSSKLLERMDYNYHQFQAKHIKAGFTLRHLSPKIFRGLNSKKELENLFGLGSFFHLGDFSTGNKIGLSYRKMPLGTGIALSGDILIARVGKRSIGKVAFLAKGKITVSDCILVVRVKKEYREKIFNVLKSKLTKDFLHAYSSGVCSRFITVDNLLNVPIPRSTSKDLI